MSQAVGAPVPLVATREPAARRGTLSIAERNFLRTFVYTSAIVALFYCAFHIEREVLHRRPAAIRFIPEAAEAAMRYVGIPHVIIGFLFMASAVKNRTPSRRAWIGGLLLVGAVLSYGFWEGGGKANLVLYAGVYLYFLVHELRDESNFCLILGDAPSPSNPAAFRAMILWMIGLIVTAFVVLGYASLPFGLFHRRFNADDSVLAGSSFAQSVLVAGRLPMPLKLILSLAPVAATAFGFVHVLRHYARALGFGSVHGLIHTYASVFRIMLGVAGVLVLSLLITQRPHSLALFHFVAWYVFASYQLAKHPPKSPPAGWWTWMRTTASGFKTLHIGMVLGLMGLALFWTLALDPTDTSSWFTRLLAPAAFPYWTIMHVTVSFVPR